MKKVSISAFKVAGFTLIELMIAIAIVAVLATLSFSGIENHVMRTRRADAQAALMELAHFMERTYATNGSYFINGASPALPFTTTPRDSNNPSYQITLARITAQTYTLRARPTAGGGQNNDPCGTLTLAHTGETTPTTNNCWVQ